MQVLCIPLVPAPVDFLEKTDLVKTVALAVDLEASDKLNLSVEVGRAARLPGSDTQCQPALFPVICDLRLRDHFLHDQLLSTPHVYFIYFGSTV